MMKSFKKIYKLILVAMLIILPKSHSMAADNISVPISIEWTYEGKKWANSPHKSSIEIKAQNGAPAPSIDSFDYPGDYMVYFTKPSFSKVGKYEYLVYQTNQDFEEAGRSVSYDKTIYRLIFFIQEANDRLITSVYAYDDSKYNSDDKNYNKQARITFINDDPYIHKNNGEIVDPNDPYHPFHPENPWYPYNPKDPTNPYNPKDPTNPYFPVDPNRPTDPTNLDRNKNNTPIYPTEPSNLDRPNGPINPSKPLIEGRDADYWPEREEPKPIADRPFPWWWDKLFPNIDYNPKDLAKVATDPSRNENQGVGAGSDEDRFKDNSNRFFPYGRGSNNSLNSSIVEGNRRDKNSKTNVKTGIRSISLWLLILVLASILYIITRNKNKKESY